MYSLYSIIFADITDPSALISIKDILFILVTLQLLAKISLGI